MALYKRAWDHRVLTVDMSLVMRTDDTIESVVSVTATPLTAGASAVTVSGITHSDTAVSFECSGGSDGDRYDITVRVETAGDPEQMIENVELLIVEGEAGESGATPETPLTPAVTRHTNYLLASVNDVFTAPEVIASGTNSALEVPAGTVPAGERRYFAYARLNSEGAYSYIYLYPAGHRDPQSQLAGFLDDGSVTEIDSVEQRLLRSRVTYGENANGTVFEAG